MSRRETFSANSRGSVPCQWLLLLVRVNIDTESSNHFVDKFTRDLGALKYAIAQQPQQIMLAEDTEHAAQLLANSLSPRIEFVVAVFPDRTLTQGKNGLLNEARNRKLHPKIFGVKESDVRRCRYTTNQYTANSHQVNKSTYLAETFLRLFGPSKTASSSNATNQTAPAVRQQYGISYDQIEKICKDLDDNRLLTGSSDLLAKVRTNNFYARLEDLWPEVNKQVKFVRVIAASVSSIQADLSQLTHEFLMNVFQSSFVSFLVKTHVTPMAYDPRKQSEVYLQLVEHLVVLLRIGLEVLPSSMDKHLPDVQVMLCTLKSPNIANILLATTQAQLDRLEASLQALFTSKTTQIMSEEQRRATQPSGSFEGSGGAPPEDFRKLSVVPTRFDVINTGGIYLRAAKKSGQYDSDEHYLDVIFRLLREDLCRPLRDGIQEYRSVGGGRKRTDLYVFKSVILEPPVLEKRNGELLCYAQLKINHRMRWNKRLTFGSLVCLSADNFHQSFVFAVVLDRDAEVLAKSKIGLRFENPAEASTKLEYSMVESPAFFEAYKHVMLALQSYEINSPVPFSKYLVRAEKKTELPRYLRLDPQKREWNFKTLLKGEARLRFKDQLVDVTRIDPTFQPTDFSMDRNQFDALEYALNTELAVIQGPPGTGKTFIGLQLVKLLFDNEANWNPIDDHRPMLVVCYTNHALDQFLEGISEFMPTGLVRIGGRSKNPVMEQYQLNKIRREGTWESQAARHQFFESRGELNYTATKLRCVSEKYSLLQSRLVRAELLAENISGDFETKTKGEFSENPYKMLQWLTSSSRPRMNVPAIRKLMREMPRLAEHAAKQAYYCCFSKEGPAKPDEIVKWLKQKDRQVELNAADHKIQHWPPLAVIKRLTDLGIHEEVATEMLSSVKGDFERVFTEHAQRTATGHRERPIEVIPGEEAEVNELLLLEDEDERHVDDDEGLLDDEDDPPVQPNKDWYDEPRMIPFGEHIASAVPYTPAQAAAVTDIYSLSLQNRWKLYQFWVGQAKDKTKTRKKELEQLFIDLSKKVRELREMGDVGMLRKCKVIGMTTTGAAKHQAALRALKPRIVVVEEAAEILEAHLVASLTIACEHAIFIGDHKQLRPNPAVYELAKKYNLEISLFERLINNEFPYRALAKQHRMRPEISRTLMPHFYPIWRMMFLHSEPETKQSDFKSHSNPFETKFAVKLARYFIQQTYQPEQITILVTYLDQLLEVRKLMQEKFGRDHKIRVENVDNYQGEECEIIILSLVRSNNPEQKIGFLNIPNRVCVALSRAKHGLYVLGNIEFLSEKCDLWASIRESAEKVSSLGTSLPVKCQQHGNEQEIEKPEDFDRKCPEGGCSLACQVRMICGHTCMKPCHSYDPEHNSMPCTKPCARKCASEWEHPCNKRCDQKCGDCKILVPKHLLCGHSKEDFCHLAIDQVKCIMACPKQLPCGHACSKLCSIPCTTKCQVSVTRRLPCGHQAQMKCWEDPVLFKCRTLVNKAWPICGHLAETVCSTDPDSVACPQPCATHCLNVDICAQVLVGLVAMDASMWCAAKIAPESLCVVMLVSPNVPNKCGKVDMDDGPRKNKKIRDSGSGKGRKTGRRCGDPCPACAEPCLNRCRHRQCDKLCGVPCGVSPCVEPCPKVLKCSPRLPKNILGPVEQPHYCISVCGEECIQLCKICEPEKFKEVQEVLFGTEEDEDACFVQLKDCKHIIEVSGLDHWLEAEWKELLSEVNQKFDDIQETAKLSKYPEKGLKASKLYRKVQESFTNSKISNVTVTYISTAKNIYRVTKELAKQWKSLHLLHFHSISSDDTGGSSMGLLGRVFAGSRNTSSFTSLKAILCKYKIKGLQESLMDELLYLLDRIASQQISSISETMLEQLTNELARYEFIVNFYKYLSKLIGQAKQLDDQSRAFLQTLLADLNGNKEFLGDHEAHLKSIFQRLVNHLKVDGLDISDSERISIVKALSGHVTKWYECGKGHIYGIGECGMAMVQSQCPECGELVGGSSHTLVSTSRSTDLMTRGIIQPPLPNPFVVRYH
uniref:RZ-type domain-containing protein n=1 Tax=Ditylenchus dipsaci TaxID=166011 RepID=A0A915DE83_9BILA